MTTHVYVSWGGTGRSASLREAVRQTQGEGNSLIYLAVLDDTSFSDLDQTMLDLVVNELEWVLDAQVQMATAQVGQPLVPVELIVRYGGVVAEVSEVTSSLNKPKILVGAPVPVAGHESVADLIAALEASTGCVVSLVEPV